MIEHNGKMYARVSEILQSYTNFGHIKPEILANKARIGTEVHQAIADDIKGDFIYLKKDSIGYFQSYEKWKEKINPTFIQSETRYFDHEKMITGQIDGLINFEGNMIMPCLVDFKTSVTESKETWGMQAHMYAFLMGINNIEINRLFIFVKLNKFGELPIVYQYKFDTNIHAKCMNAIDNFWNKQKILTKDDKI